MFVLVAAWGRLAQAVVIPVDVWSLFLFSVKALNVFTCPSDEDIQNSHV